jgi:hypothetical protein
MMGTTIYINGEIGFDSCTDVIKQVKNQSAAEIIFLVKKIQLAVMLMLVMDIYNYLKNCFTFSSNNITQQSILNC